VLSVNLRESKEVVEKAARERGYTFPVLPDSTAEMAQRYQVRATPTASAWCEPYGGDRQGVDGA
jgi:hypothetical protein